MNLLFLTPPLTQLSFPYPASAFLVGFLRSRGIPCAQADLAIELVLALFSRAGIERVLAALPAGKQTPAIEHFIDHADRILAVIDPVIGFLQGRDPTLALRIASRDFLPEGPRFSSRDEMGDDPNESLHWAFGALGAQDLAKFLATLFLADLADAVREGIDPHFELSRYAEKLAMSAPSFDPLQQALDAPPTLVDEILCELALAKIGQHRPGLVCLTAPFPGNVYGAFRIARAVKLANPAVRTAFGGGYANTELRDLAEPRVFDHFDFVCLDDGERTLPGLLEHLEGRRPASRLCKTYVRENGRVVFHHDDSIPPVPHAQCGTPTYDGLPLDRYLHVFDTLNPMHRIWSDGRWNKLMVAHGCYWSKCTFCDTRLEYIERYSTAPADHLVDQMTALIRETGQTGFHFVDEAAPPAMLKKLSERLLARNVTATWWGNIRFDTYFTREVCELMARAGCVAVTGGLEVAEDRLLELMQKGVSVAQVARVTKNFTDAGIMVHAYLMYGFPTQTELETVNALEYVRQLFAAGCLQSAYWHRFALTLHAPVFQSLETLGIRISNDWKSSELAEATAVPRTKKGKQESRRDAETGSEQSRRAGAPPLQPSSPPLFARNEIPFTDSTGVDHDALGAGLRKALYNYMHGVGLDEDVRVWFDHPVPKTTVKKTFIARALRPAHPPSEA